MMIPPKRPGNDQTTLQRISGWPAFAAHLGAVASQLLPWPTVGKSPHMNGQMIPTVSGFLHWFLHWSFSLHGNISHPPFKVFPSQTPPFSLGMSRSTVHGANSNASLVALSSYTPSSWIHSFSVPDGIVDLLVAIQYTYSIYILLYVYLYKISMYADLISR